jgi:hypothetical protein
MICTCPKCAAPIEMDLSKAGETGTATKCTACKARLQISREPFVRRAYRRHSEVSCAHCGNQLGHYLNCPSCGELYPDYFVAETPDAIRKRTRKVSSSFRSLKNISFEWRSAPAKDQAYRPAAIAGTASVPTQTAVEANRKALFKVVGLVALVAALAGGFAFYKHHQSKQQFAANFVRAIYVIKTGMELNLKTCARLTADWRAKGGGPAPRVSADEEAKLVKVKDEIDKIQQLLENPPKSFTPATEKLGKLKGVYVNLQTLTMAPPNAINVFTDAAGKAEGDFKKTAMELKADMPVELSDALTKARTDYTGLRDF